MSTKNTSNRNSEYAKAELDALLTRGVLADKRAHKPPAAAAAPAAVPLPSPQSLPAATTAPVNRWTERLSVRYTREESQLLENARAAARSMGFKLSDSAVLRVALNAFKPELMTAQSIQAVLAADTRYKHIKATSTR